MLITTSLAFLLPQNSVARLPDEGIRLFWRLDLLTYLEPEENDALGIFSPWLAAALVADVAAAAYDGFALQFFLILVFFLSVLSLQLLRHYTSLVRFALMFF